MNLQMALLNSARERLFNLIGTFRKYYSGSDTSLTEMAVLEYNYPKIFLARIA